MAAPKQRHERCADLSSADAQDRNRTSQRGPALLLLEQAFQIIVEPRHTLGVAVLVRSARLRCGLFVFRRGVPLMIGTGVTATLFNEINKVERSPECRQGLFFDQYSQKSIHDAQSCLRDCRWSAFFQDGHR